MAQVKKKTSTIKKKIKKIPKKKIKVPKNNKKPESKLNTVKGVAGLVAGVSAIALAHHIYNKKQNKFELQKQKLNPVEQKKSNWGLLRFSKKKEETTSYHKENPPRNPLIKVEFPSFFKKLKVKFKTYTGTKHSKVEPNEDVFYDARNIPASIE